MAGVVILSMEWPAVAACPSAAWRGAPRGACDSPGERVCSSDAAERSSVSGAESGSPGVCV